MSELANERGCVRANEQTNEWTHDRKYCYDVFNKLFR